MIDLKEFLNAEKLYRFNSYNTCEIPDSILNELIKYIGFKHHCEPETWYHLYRHLIIIEPEDQLQWFSSVVESYQDRVIIRDLYNSVLKPFAIKKGIKVAEHFEEDLFLFDFGSHTLELSRYSDGRTYRAIIKNLSTNGDEEEIVLRCLDIYFSYRKKKYKVLLDHKTKRLFSLYIMPDFFN